MCCNIKDLNNQKFIQYISKDVDISPENKIRIKDILNDKWDDFVIYANQHNLKIRNIIFHEVERVRKCVCLSEVIIHYEQLFVNVFLKFFSSFHRMFRQRFVCL